MCEARGKSEVTHTHYSGHSLEFLLASHLIHEFNGNFVETSYLRSAFSCKKEEKNDVRFYFANLIGAGQSVILVYSAYL